MPQSLCPSCGGTQPVPIEFGRCIKCHDRRYQAALIGTEWGDPIALRVLAVYRRRARDVLEGRPANVVPLRA